MVFILISPQFMISFSVFKDKYNERHLCFDFTFDVKLEQKTEVRFDRRVEGILLREKMLRYRKENRYKMSKVLDVTIAIKISSTL